MSLIYSILDINNIMFQGFDYRLPDQNLKTISDLEKIMGNSVPVESTSSVKPKSYDKKPQRNIQSTPSNDEWAVVRTSFKPTKIDVKEGIEKDINTIRTSLNKISTKNYDLQRDTIIEFITAFLEKQASSEILQEDQLQNISKIGHSIFDIASTNKNNSMLYASLYKDLINKFEIFGTILSEFVGNFKNTIQNIHYVDPSTDYDMFCAYTKSNDSRKSTTMFLINSMKLGLVSTDTVIDIIQYFQSTVFEYIEQSGRTNEVEEIIENIFIFVSQCSSQFAANEHWAQIVGHVKQISEMKPKEHPSLTNRATFKCLDTLDSLSA